MPILSPSSPRPLYLQVADYLRRQIDTGVWPPEAQLPPELELAAQLEVSRGTVRQAMQLMVNQGLLQRMAGKGTFVTRPEARPRSQLVGMVVPYLRDSLTTEILRGVDSTLRRSTYSLVFGHSEGDLELERMQIDRLLQQGVSGLILFPVGAEGEATLLANLLPPRFPLTIIDRRLPGLSADTVVVDNVGGAYRAVEHLLALGHERIACIATRGRPSTVVDRIAGYEQALRDAGILPLAAVALSRRQGRSGDGTPTYTPEDLVPVDQLLSARDAPTALFCVNDFIALGVMQHVLAQGRRVPQDLAIVGFDDIAMAAHMSLPLTTVAQPKYEIGAQAAQMLIDQIAGVARPGREVVLPTSLVVRASSGAPGSPGQASSPAEAGGGES